MLNEIEVKKKNVLNFRWYFNRARQNTPRESAEKYVTRKVRSLNADVIVLCIVHIWYWTPHGWCNGMVSKLG